MSVYIVFMDNTQLEQLMFCAVRAYYSRDKILLRGELAWLITNPRYKTYCMRCAWWKRFLIDADTFLS